MLEFNGTFIVLAISFVVFVILENFIFYRPLKKVIAERASYIKENEDCADKNYCAANVLLEEREQKIKQANEKSSQILNVANQETQKKFDIAIQEAKTNSNRVINEEKENLENQKAQVKNALKQEIGGYVSTIISKILKKDVAIVNVNDEIVEKALRGEL